MAVITPSTDLYLLKVPLEIDEMNQLDFADATAQYNYFSTLPKITVDDFTYQRKDYTIRFPALYDDIITYNYVVYRNDAYSNKWFYAFITDMQYINDNMTMITIKNDPWQCWQFDLTYKPCLIEREHANTDNPGDNLLPESLELGEFVTNGSTSNFGGSSSSVIVVEVTQLENEGTGKTLGYTPEYWYGGSLTPKMNGLPRGTTPLIVEYGTHGSQQVTAPSFDEVRDIYDKAGLGDAIVDVYPLPSALISVLGNIQGNLITLNLYNGDTVVDSVEHVLIPYPDGSTTTDFSSQSFSKPTSIDGFIPKNKKLLTSPYCYFNISNNSGVSIPYHYEDFDTTVEFDVEGVFSISGCFKAIPKKYKKLGTSGNALDYSVTGGKLPVGSWKSDSYTNWLTQNAVNMNVQMGREILGAGVDIVGSAVRGAMAGGLVGGALGAGLGIVTGGASILGVAKEQMLAKTQANFTPDQVHGNTNAGDFVWSYNRTAFTYLPMSIKAQSARVIDDYFSMFGYATNRVKVPNITGRRNWNFVKTVGCYIEADIPQDDLQEIKNMFDRGFTIWHNASNFGNYSVNNDIIV